MTARRNIMLGTAGHVDHGKTALVKLLTGCDTDRLAEEKRRGLTIEIGFAPCKLADQRICGIVDVPGHYDFIRNMAAGAHGIDVAILVIAADDGVMPQTREHLDILTLLGVRRGLVALTKADLVDAEGLALAVDDVRAFITGTFLEGAEICPVSNTTGSGYEAFFDALNRQVDLCGPHDSSGLFRLWIDKTFSVRGFGTVVSGVPAGGSVKVGDKLTLLPDGLACRVRGLQVYGQDSQQAGAGECVAINLADIDAGKLVRGAVLTASNAFEPVTMFEADLQLLGHVPAAIGDYPEVHLHVGSAQMSARVAILDGDVLTPGRHSLVQVRLAEPLGVAAGDRFIIRSTVSQLADGRISTIGGGRVLATSNVRLRRNRPWNLAALNRRLATIDSPLEWAATHLLEIGAAVTVSQLGASCGRPADVTATLVSTLVEQGRAKVAGTKVVHQDVVSDACRSIVCALEAFHAANPHRAGAGRGQLLDAACAPNAAGQAGCRAAAELAIDQLLSEGRILHRGEVFSLPGKQASLDAAQQQACSDLENLLKTAGLAPPTVSELAQEGRMTPATLASMLDLLADRGVIVKLDQKIVMHADALQRAKEVALDLFRKSGSFETVDFRDALGVSRKFAVPLLDYFDTIRFTTRTGSRRRPGQEARKLLNM